jgi:hypothetical protein
MRIGAVVEIVPGQRGDSPELPRMCSLKSSSTVHHLCDRYDLKYEEVLAESSDLYRHQQDRDLNKLGITGVTALALALVGCRDFI